MHFHVPYHNQTVAWIWNSRCLVRKGRSPCQRDRAPSPRWSRGHGLTDAQRNISTRMLGPGIRQPHPGSIQADHKYTTLSSTVSCDTHTHTRCKPTNSMYSYDKRTCLPTSALRPAPCNPFPHPHLSRPTRLDIRPPIPFFVPSPSPTTSLLTVLPPIEEARRSPDRVTARPSIEPPP